MEKLTCFGPWMQRDIQFCRLNNYDLTYTFYSKFPSWGFLPARLRPHEASRSPILLFSLIFSNLTLCVLACFASSSNKYSPSFVAALICMAEIFILQWMYQNMYTHRFRKMYYMWYEKISWEWALWKSNSKGNLYGMGLCNCSYISSKFVKFGTILTVASLCLESRWQMHFEKVLPYLMLVS